MTLATLNPPSDRLARTSAMARSDRLGELQACLDAMEFDAADWYEVGAAFRMLVDAGFDRMPLPGSGNTGDRWRSLAAVAGRDLSLVKLFEGHTDALAILAELTPGHTSAARYWGVWASESAHAQLQARPLTGDTVQLSGVKQWCSGAAVVSHALVSATEPGGASGLYAVELAQPGVFIASGGWHAVGMQATASVAVEFEQAQAHRIARAGEYTARPGFWQGGAGIAACWFGAAATLARAVRDAAQARPDPHRNAHLGNIMVALGEAAATLRETAAAIDLAPAADARWLALQARLSVEQACSTIVQHAGRALGAAPLCLDAQIARLMADLPVFMRQSHAERDLAALGEFHAQRAPVGGEAMPQASHAGRALPLVNASWQI